MTGLMRGLLVALVAVGLLALIAPQPALAGGDAFGGKLLNTVSNTALGWTECPKALADEVGKAQSRGYIGVVVTAPLMCGVNVAVRYAGTAIDWVTLPWGGNAQPPVAAGPAPLIAIPK